MPDLMTRRRSTVLICVFAFVVLFVVLSNKKTITIIKYMPTLETFGIGSSEPRHVFFDLGANIGDSAQMFVDPKYPSDHPLKGYAAKNNQKWEIYSLEANPVHDEKLDETKKLVESLGHTHYLMKQTAAWVTNEKMTFYLDTVNKGQHFWGSSLHKEHHDARKSNFSNIEVTAIDIPALVQEYRMEDEIVFKLDIEGTEWKIIDTMIRDGSIFLIDIITVEFHGIFKTDINVHKLIDNYKWFFKQFNITYYPWYLRHQAWHA